MNKEEPQSNAAGGASALTAGLCIDAVETVQTLGFEWVRPNQQVDNDMASCFNRFRGIAIQTSAGTLVLARVEKFSRGMLGGVRRVLVSADELNTVDA